MLNICVCFSSSYSLVFNAAKTQLIKFSSCCSLPSRDSAELSFFEQKLQLTSQSVTHLGHILSHDLSDKEDIASVKKDLRTEKANSMLSIFSSCDQYTKSKLLQSFCLSLYGVSLWMALKSTTNCCRSSSFPPNRTFD